MRQPLIMRLGVLSSKKSIPQTAFTYWRMFFTESNDTVQNKYISISEINFRSTVGTDSSMTGTKTASSAFFYGGVTYYPSNATDNDANSAWITAAGLHISSWWQIQFAEPTEVKQVKFQAYPSTAGAIQMFKSGYLQRSNNGTNWTTVLTISNQTGWTPGEIRTFTVT